MEMADSQTSFLPYKNIMFYRIKNYYTKGCEE